MNLKLLNVSDKGNLDKERITFLASADLDLGYFMVFKSKLRADKEKVSSKIEYVYWFPDKKIKKDDLVVLYSKEGADSKKNNEDGTTSYFFYWEQKSNLFNDDFDVIIYSKLETWRTGSPTKDSE